MSGSYQLAMRPVTYGDMLIFLIGVGVGVFLFVKYGVRQKRYLNGSIYFAISVFAGAYFSSLNYRLFRQGEEEQSASPIRNAITVAKHELRDSLPSLSDAEFVELSDQRSAVTKDQTGQAIKLIMSQIKGPNGIVYKIDATSDLDEAPEGTKGSIAFEGISDRHRTTVFCDFDKGIAIADVQKACATQVGQLFKIDILR